ncbi:MAG: hypothetical protein QOE58_1299, partial [Actinomycetota bacterium]|nr:hypothetical protein [Actinomycetota bacterium]
RLSRLRSPILTDTTIIDGVFGPDEATAVVLMRAFDVWVHEQDIRSALDRPGNLDSPAARVFVNAVMAQLPRLVSRDAGLEPGQVVVIEVTGPLLTRQAVLVEVDDRGRPRGRVLGSGEMPARQSEGHRDGPTTISLSTEAFTRRAAGRRSVRETEYNVVGDEAIADRVMEALVITH